MQGRPVQLEESPNSCQGRTASPHQQTGPDSRIQARGWRGEHRHKWIGIDIGKAKLDIAVHPSGERWQVDNNAASRSSCQDVWTFLPEGCGLGHGIASEEFDTEEFTDGQDLAATAAFTADADVATP